MLQKTKLPTLNEQSGGFEKKAFLVVDSNPGMRTSMRMTISTFGGVIIDMASSVNDALHKMERKSYDVILCDYDLGEGKSGQQLLDEIKRKKLIKHSSIFMMVTAEQRYERVVSAVELAPDDYLIKPFTGEALRIRLVRQATKKTFLASVYDAMDQQDLHRAVIACDAILALNTQYQIDLLRLKGDLYLMLGECAEAKQIFEQILGIKDLPWAKMGLAKSLFHQDAYEEAAEIFLHVTEDNPNYMEAYDWLAKSYTALGDDSSAQKTLTKVTQKSPRMLPRQKMLGEVAYGNGDLDAAMISFGAVLKYGQNSSFTSPEDFANMSRVHMDKGDFAQALSTMKDARKTFNGSPDAELHAAIMDSMIHHQSGDIEAANKSFETAKFLYEIAEKSPGKASFDLADACFMKGDEKAGEAIIKKIVINNHDNKRVLKQTETFFKQKGMEDKGAAIIQASSREVIALNNRAVKMAQAGDVKGAVDILMEAVNVYHANTFITLNAAHAILVYMQKSGWDDVLWQTAKQYLQKVKDMDANNKKLLMLLNLSKELAQKFGVKV